MSQDNSSRPVSPELKRLQQPKQSSIRKGLRIAGPIIFLVGLICTIIAFASLLLSAGSFDGPHYFWLGFIGLPLMFVGGVLCQFGFLGAVARFVAGESAPVAADTVNYMAEETKGAVETVAKTAAKGVVEGIDSGRAKAGEGKD
jgi:hypothetical protein